MYNLHFKLVYSNTIIYPENVYSQDSPVLNLKRKQDTKISLNEPLTSFRVESIFEPKMWQVDLW